MFNIEQSPGGVDLFLIVRILYSTAGVVVFVYPLEMYKAFRFGLAQWLATFGICPLKTE